jgi:opacity protein-like surface antigen
MPGVTPRLSPGFASNTVTSFAYSVGAGVDWQIKPEFILSLSYEYQDLGKIETEDGKNSWSGAALHSDTYRTNGALLSLSYLFG